jgi:hypothetical protein
MLAIELIDTQSVGLLEKTSWNQILLTYFVRISVLSPWDSYHEFDNSISGFYSMISPLWYNCRNCLLWNDTVTCIALWKLQHQRWLTESK